MDVGFVGLGAMGAPMAANLLGAGIPLTVHNRTRSRAEPLATRGASVAHRAAEAARGEVVVTMLADDRALEDVAFGADGIVAALPRGGVHVSMSTISAALARRLADAHREAGSHFVAAPVFGRPEAAAAAKLFIVAGGSAEAIDRCSPLFDRLGQRTFRTGDDPVSAVIVKLSGNFLIASVIESLGEAMALVRKNGVDPAAYVEILTSTLFAAPVYRTYGALIAEERYRPAGFRLALGLKDIGLVLQAAQSAAVPMPLASLVRDHMVAGLAQGHDDDDWAVIARVAARSAGL